MALGVPRAAMQYDKITLLLKHFKIHKVTSGGQHSPPGHTLWFNPCKMELTATFYHLWKTSMSHHATKKVKVWGVAAGAASFKWATSFTRRCHIWWHRLRPGQWLIETAALARPLRVELTSSCLVIFNIQARCCSIKHARWTVSSLICSKSKMFLTLSPWLSG